jgi:hypothetical protein
LAAEPNRDVAWIASATAVPAKGLSIGAAPDTAGNARMDVGEFSDWLRGIERLSAGQRRAALAVLAKVGEGGGWRLSERDGVRLRAERSQSEAPKRGFRSDALETEGP